MERKGGYRSVVMDEVQSLGVRVIRFAAGDPSINRRMRGCVSMVKIFAFCKDIKILGIWL